MTDSIKELAKLWQRYRNYGHEHWDTPERFTVPTFQGFMDWLANQVQKDEVDMTDGGGW